MDPAAAIYDDVYELATAPAGPAAPCLQCLEHTLTSGYAQALALEGERLRLARRISEVSKLANADSEPHAGELALLRERLDDADRDLSRLRGVLLLLKERTRQARGARAA